MERLFLDSSLEAIQEYHRDYLVQVKGNQEKVLEHVERVFVDAPKQKPSNCHSSKKKGHVEVRRLWVKKWAAEYVRESLGMRRISVIGWCVGMRHCWTSN